MLRALDEAFAQRRTTTDELLRTLIGQTRLIWRQMVANAGGDDPGDLDVRLPGDPPPPPPPRTSMRDLARRALRGR